MKRFLNILSLTAALFILFSCNLQNEEQPSLTTTLGFTMPGKITTNADSGRGPSNSTEIVTNSTEIVSTGSIFDNKNYDIKLYKKSLLVSMQCVKSGNKAYFYDVEPGDDYAIFVFVYELTDTEKTVPLKVGISGNTADITDDTTEEMLMQRAKFSVSAGEVTNVKINWITRASGGSTNENILGGFIEDEYTDGRYRSNYYMPENLKNSLEVGATIVFKVKGTVSFPELYVQLGVMNEAKDTVNTLADQFNAHYSLPIQKGSAEYWEIVLPLNDIQLKKEVTVGDTVYQNNGSYNTVQFFFDDEGEEYIDGIESAIGDISFTYEIISAESSYVELVKDINYDGSTSNIYPYRFVYDYVLNDDEMLNIKESSGRSFELSVSGTINNEKALPVSVQLLNSDYQLYGNNTKFTWTATDNSMTGSYNSAIDNTKLILQISVPFAEGASRVHIKNFDVETKILN